MVHPMKPRHFRSGCPRLAALSKSQEYYTITDAIQERLAITVTLCHQTWHAGSHGPLLKMVGGLEHSLFFGILGVIFPIAFQIFKRGSNHQPVICCWLNHVETTISSDFPTCRVWCPEGKNQRYQPHMLHGAHLPTWLGLEYGANVGKYSSTMEHLGTKHNGKKTLWRWVNN